jgi:hypothetical protein
MSLHFFPTNDRRRKSSCLRRLRLRDCGSFNDSSPQYLCSMPRPIPPRNRSRLKFHWTAKLSAVSFAPQAADFSCPWRCKCHHVCFKSVLSAQSSLWLPKTPSDLKMQRFRSFVRSWWYLDELSFRRPFRSGSLQFSNPSRPAGGDPRASSPTRSFPKERAASLALPALRPALVGFVIAMVAGLAP